MEELKDFDDSTSVAGSQSALRERYVSDGYLFFRGLLDSSEVDEVRNDILNSLAPLGWLAPSSDPADALPAELVRREADPNWWDGYNAILGLESFNRLAHNPKIVDMVGRLLGEEILVHPRKIGRVTYPSSDHPTPPHQDFPLIQGTTDTITAWVPLADIPISFGGLRVLVGSHREGLMQIQGMKGVGGIGVPVDEEGPNWRTTHYRPGDLLIFSSLTVHYAPPHNGARLRLSADYRYQSAKEPVVNGSLHPHGHGNGVVPDWPELTNGWSSMRWIEVPAEINEVEVINPAEIQAPPSRLLPRP